MDEAAKIDYDPTLFRSQGKISFEMMPLKKIKQKRQIFKITWQLNRMFLFHFMVKLPQIA